MKRVYETINANSIPLGKTLKISTSELFDETPNILERRQNILACNNNFYLIDIKEDVTQIQRLSNYVIIPECLVTETYTDKVREHKSQYSIVKIIRSDDPSTILAKELRGRDEVSLKAFIEKISEPGLIQYFTGQNFNLLKQYLYRNIRKQTNFVRIGYNSSYDFYVWGNCLYSFSDNKLHFKAPQSGLMQLADGKAFGISEKNQHKTQLIFRDNSTEVLRAFFQNVAKAYDDSSVFMITGAVLATAFIDIFWENAEGFPFMFLFGIPQAGKTILQKALAALFGFTKTSDQRSGLSTTFAVRKDLESLHNVPLFIEEANDVTVGALSLLGKDVYAGTPRVRGGKDGEIEQMHINTSFVVTSNDFFKDMSPAFLTRAIFLDLKVKPKNLDQFKYVAQDSLRELSCILPQLLAYRGDVMTYYQKQLELVRSIDGTKDRYHNNIAISMAIWDIINQIAEEEIIDIPKTIKEYLDFYKPYLGCEVSDVDKLMNEFSRLSSQGVLSYGFHYVLTKETNLRLHVDRFLKAYNEMNPKTILSKNSFKLLAARDSRFNLKSSDVAPIGRAIHINLSTQEALAEELRAQKEEYSLRTSFKIEEEN